LNRGSSGQTPRQRALRSRHDRNVIEREATPAVGQARGRALAGAARSDEQHALAVELDRGGVQHHATLAVDDRGCHGSQQPDERLGYLRNSRRDGIAMLADLRDLGLEAARAHEGGGARRIVLAADGITPLSEVVAAVDVHGAHDVGDHARVDAAAPEALIVAEQVVLQRLGAE
jgi:hypothetical protein